MTDEKTWEILSEAGKIFNEKGHEESTSWLVNDSGLSNSEFMAFDKFTRGLYDKLYRRYFMKIEEGGEDTRIDVLWQVIANGQKFYETINIDKLNKMAEDGDFNESFVYVITDAEFKYDRPTKKIAKIPSSKFSIRRHQFVRKGQYYRKIVSRQIF